MTTSKLLENTNPAMWAARLAVERTANEKRNGPYGAPVALCPYCGETCEADWVDVEVGLVQCGPYFCACGASQIGPESSEGRSEDEKRCGWYEPGEPPSSHANTVGGVLVDHRTAEVLYEMGLLDAPRPSPRDRDSIIGIDQI